MGAWRCAEPGGKSAWRCSGRGGGGGEECVEVRWMGGKALDSAGKGMHGGALAGIKSL